MSKIRKYCLLLLVITIGFWQCAEPDLEIVKSIDDGVSFGVKPTKMKRVDAATVVLNPRMTELMYKLQRKTIYKTVANQRTMTDSTAFKLQLTDIVMIEDQGYVSYTFGVLREQENDLLENVIINVYPGGVIKTYFVEYDVTASEREMIKNNIEVNLDGKTESFLIDDFEEVFSNPDALYLRIPRDFTLCPQITTVTVSDSCPTGMHDWANVNDCIFYNGSTEFDIPQFAWTPTVSYVYQVVYVPCEGGGGGAYVGGGGPTSPPTSGNPTNPGDGSDPDDNLADDFSLDDGAGGDIKTVPVVPDPIDNETRTVKRLMNYVKNKEDGTKTNIKTRIDQLNIGRLTSLKENGYMFDNDQNTLASFNQGSNWTAWANAATSFYIILHMHQDFFIPENSTVAKPTNVAPSDTDVVGLLKLLDYTNNRNSTSIIVSRMGTFAMTISDKSKAIDAFDALLNDKKIGKDFSDEYNKLVMKPYETMPLDDDAVMDGFIEFVNNYLVNGQSMGLSFYQAVNDSQGNIINWVKL